jgi:hypothetical protein
MQHIDIELLATVIGGAATDWNKIVDNGNRWSVPGSIVGGTIGGLAAGLPTAGFGAPAGIGGGALLGSGVGWLGGAAYEAGKQRAFG